MVIWDLTTGPNFWVTGDDGDSRHLIGRTNWWFKTFHEFPHTHLHYISKQDAYKSLKIF